MNCISALLAPLGCEAAEELDMFPLSLLDIWLMSWPPQPAISIRPTADPAETAIRVETARVSIIFFSWNVLLCRKFFWGGAVDPDGQ